LREFDSGIYAVDALETQPRYPVAAPFVAASA
jgi:hypothetical protein